MAKEKKKRRRGGCLVWIVGLFAIIIVGGALSEGEPVQDENVDADEIEEIVDDEQVVEEDVEEIEEEIEEEQVEENTDEEVLVEEEPEEDIASKENFKDYIDHEIMDGVDVFTYNRDIVWSFDSQLRDFNMDNTELLSEFHTDINNGAVFRLVGGLGDGYGNNTENIILIAYYEQETIDKINYENWPARFETGLFDSADSIIVHFAYRDAIDVENNTNGTPPPVYYNSMGEEYNN